MNVVDFIEAAYDVESPMVTWLRGLGLGLRGLLGDTWGVIGLCYDASDPARVRLDPMITLEPAAFVLGAMETAHRMAPAWAAKRVYWGGVRCATMSQTIGPMWTAMPFFRTIVRPFGVQDFFSLRAADLGQRGVVISTSLRRMQRVGKREAEFWERLGAHVASGLRLRRRAQSATIEAADAVLSPDGHVEHAVGDAKEPELRGALAEATRRVDRARGRMRRTDPDEAMALWQALVEGKWSLVDFVDHDGRRYVIARENAPPAPAARPLTPRERQVVAFVAQGDSNKLIAYELGISETAVAVHVSNAARKLGAGSRVELIAAYRASLNP